MTEEELRRMIREALAASRGQGQDEEVLRTPIGLEDREYPVSYAKQLPQGLLSEQKVDIPGTDGKQIGIQHSVKMPVGSVNLSGGYMPTFGQKNASIGYSVPVGEGSIAVSGNISTDPRQEGASKTVGATYSRKMLEDLYLNAYVNQLLNGKSNPQFGIGIQGLF